MTTHNKFYEKGKKSFWDTTIGTIAKITALLTAITGLILAVNPYLNYSGTVAEPAFKNENITSGNTSSNNDLTENKKNKEEVKTSNNPPKKYNPSLSEISAFLKAAEIGNIEGLKSELDLGIDVDVTLNDDPTTALVNAVLNNQPKAVKLLLDYKANPDIKIKSGSYPIIEASYGGYSEIVSLLLQHKVNVEVRKLDGSGINALMFACIQGNKNIVQKLIEAGADPNTKSFQNSTALNYAKEKPSPLKEELVAILNSSGSLH